MTTDLPGLSTEPREPSTGPVEVSDAALMRMAQADDNDAFGRLAERYQAPLLRLARSRVRRGDWAEEVVQETLLSAYRSRRTFDPRFSFRTWLWTILLNQCKAHAARRMRQPLAASFSDSDIGDDGALPANGETPFAALWRKQRAELLDQLLERLPAPQADALRLRFFAELKFQEIADTMGCSLLTAKNRVRAGLLKLAAAAPLELADHSQRQNSVGSSSPGSPESIPGNTVSDG